MSKKGGGLAAPERASVRIIFRTQIMYYEHLLPEGFYFFKSLEGLISKDWEIICDYTGTSLFQICDCKRVLHTPSQECLHI